MNRRIGCILIFFGLNGYPFQSLGCISFDFGPLVREVNLSGKMKYLSYCAVVEYILSLYSWCRNAGNPHFIGIALVGAPWWVGSRDNE